MTDRSGKPDDDDWQTPQWLYGLLDSAFGFDFDPCPLQSTFDGLVIPWGKSNFINPPYNRIDKPKFIQKAYDEWRLGKTCVLLIPADTGCDRHEAVPRADTAARRGSLHRRPRGFRCTGSAA